MHMNPGPSAQSLPAPLDGVAEAHLRASLQRARPVRLAGPPADAAFTSMRAAFRPTGGLARGDDLARLLEDQGRGEALDLARLIVLRELFCFEWGDVHWVPMFQFNLRDLSVQPGPRRLYAELGTVFDGWALALWYAQPNAWLHGERPVNRLATDFDAVLDAARADRFVAAG